MTKFKHMAMWTWPDAVLKEEPQRMVSRLNEARVDIIIPYVCPQRESASTAESYCQRLQNIIEESHLHRMKVHACFDEMNAYPEMPVFDLQQVRKDGSKSGLLCPSNPAVIDYILNKLRWTLKKFDYDGINLEDSYVFNNTTIYDPAHRTEEKFQVILVCYCDYCQKHAPIEKPQWAQWKQKQLTELIEKEAGLIHSLKPGLPFSVAARMPYNLEFYASNQHEIPFYEGWPFCQSRDSFSADWVKWLRRELIDFACPMSYYHSTRIVELQTDECRQMLPDADRKIWMGLGLDTITAEYRQIKNDDVYRNDAKAIESHLNNQLRIGQENVIFFSYEGLLDEHIPVLAHFSEKNL